ncbi:MAG TPA: DNA-binding protein WhiA [Clostridia bacterium]
MSFSSTVKNELCRIEANNSCCLFAELASVLRVSGIVEFSGKEGAYARIVTENAAFARKMFLTAKNLYNVSPEVVTRRSNKLKKHVSYIIVLTSAIGLKNILEKMSITCSDEGKPEHGLFDNKYLKKNCCKKAYLRGAFLAGGSLSDPEKTYHLEITSRQGLLAEELCGMLKGFGLHARTILRKGSYVSYIKEGENIVDFLNIIGAHASLLELENMRILKEMRNNVNRIVNCETANLDKTINASLRQVENITYIRDEIGFDNIPENLIEIAELRLEFSEANLKELGEMLTPALGKSGVNHRLRKLDQIAEDSRKAKGEYLNG